MSFASRKVSMALNEGAKQTWRRAKKHLSATLSLPYRVRGKADPRVVVRYGDKHLWHQTPRPRFSAQPAPGVGSIAARLHPGRRPARCGWRAVAASAATDEPGARTVALSGPSTAARALVSVRRLLSR